METEATIKEKKRSYPCSYCKGSGIAEEGDYVDVGVGMMQVSADWPCNYCDSLGMIEIGGKVHRRIVQEKLALEIIGFIKPPKEEWTNEELQDLGNRALSLLAGGDAK